MQEQESPDRAVARRVEEADALAGVWCHEALGRLRPGMETVVERIAGGVVGFFGAQSPLTQGRGLGLSGAVSKREVDRLEAFFRSRSVTATLQISPYADQELVEELGRRGFALSMFLHVLLRPMAQGENERGEKERGERERGEEAPPPPPGVTVSRVDVADAEAWARLVAQGFAGDEPVTDDGVDLNLLLFKEPSAASFVAHVDGQPVGGGSVAVHEGLASLFGMSTLPGFRRRGVQRALLDARLAYAAAAGCDLASVVTLPGSGSQRNAERVGFRVAYTRVMLSKRYP